MTNSKIWGIELSDAILNAQTEVETTCKLLEILQEAYLMYSKDSLKENRLLQSQWVVSYDKIEALVRTIAEKLVIVNEQLNFLTDFAAVSELADRSDRGRVTTFCNLPNTIKCTPKESR